MLFHSHRRSSRIESSATRRARQASPRQLLEALESRTLLTAAITNAAMTGTWSFNGMGLTGTMTFDNVGNITASSLTDRTGTASSPVGNYVLNANGALTLLFNSQSFTGAINSGQDTISISLPGTTDTLAVLTKSAGTAFTLADLNGTWSVLVNGDAGNSTGMGKLIFDGLGHILSGSYKDATGTELIIAGYYTITSGGVISATYAFADPVNHGTTTFTGQLNTKKDVLTVSPSTFQTAVTAKAPLLEMWVRSAGATVAADLAGTWSIARDGFGGTLTVDPTGLITGGSVIDAAGNLNTATGSLTVSSSGSVTLALNLTHAGITTTLQETGVLNTARNVVALENSPSKNPDSKDSLLVLTQSANRSPRLTTSTTLASAVVTTPFTITYASLLAHTNAFDVDSDPIGFVIETVTNGTLTDNGTAVVPGTTIVNAGDVLVWTPAALPTGKVQAFTVRATDGTLTTPADVPVFVTTLAMPIVTLSISHAKVTQLQAKNNTAVFTFTRSGGDMTSPLTINYTYGGTAPNDGTAFTATPLINYVAASGTVSAVVGTITIPINMRSITIGLVPKDNSIAHAGGKQTAILTLAAATGTSAGNAYTVTTTVSRQSATATIIDHNLPPTIAPPTVVIGPAVSTPFTIAYADFVTDMGAADRENEVLTFTIQAIVGTISKNGGVAAPTITLNVGDTLTWTPPAGKTGVINALKVFVSDPFAKSSTKTLQIFVS